MATSKSDQIRITVVDPELQNASVEVILHCFMKPRPGSNATARSGRRGSDASQAIGGGLCVCNSGNVTAS